MRSVTDSKNQEESQLCMQIQESVLESVHNSAHGV